MFAALNDQPRGNPHQHEAECVISLISPRSPPSRVFYLLPPPPSSFPHKKKSTKIDKIHSPRSNVPPIRDTFYSSTLPSLFSSYLTFQSWHVYPRPLISHTIPPTHADSKTTATTTTATATTTKTTISMTMTAPVYESAAPTTSTSTFPTTPQPPRPRASSPPCLLRARATPPGSPSGPRPQPQVQPCTRSARQ